MIAFVGNSCLLDFAAIDAKKDLSIFHTVYIHTYIHKLYLSSDFSVAYKLVSPILTTNFKSYSKNKAKKIKK